MMKRTKDRNARVDDDDDDGDDDGDNAGDDGDDDPECNGDNCTALNDSDKRDVPKMQCAVPMMVMVMMVMVHSAMMI